MQNAAYMQDIDKNMLFIYHILYKAAILQHPPLSSCSRFYIQGRTVTSAAIGAGGFRPIRYIYRNTIVKSVKVTILRSVRKYQRIFSNIPVPALIHNIFSLSQNFF